jgi:hypothetical protein
MMRENFYRSVKSQDHCFEIRKRFRVVFAANEERSRISEDALHMTDKFVWCSHLRGCSKGRERLGRAAQSFLCAISEAGEKMPQEQALIIHNHFPLKIQYEHSRLANEPSDLLMTD